MICSARSEASPGETFPFTLELQNVGYAAPFNSRGLELVLRHETSGQRFFAELSRDFDLRFCLPSSNRIFTAALELPASLPAGRYELLLHLPDPAPSLYGQVPCSIRLANAVVQGTNVPVWEATTGYHNLGQWLTVNSTATNPPPNAKAIPVLDYSAVRETYDAWRVRHFATNAPAGDPDAAPDSDGRSNLLEYATGSGPNSAANPDAIEAKFEAGVFVLIVRKGPGVKDVRYEVEGSPNLSPGSWSPSSVTVLSEEAARCAFASTKRLPLDFSD